MHIDKDWRSVGPVTVRDDNHGWIEFASLGEAVRWLGWRRVRDLVDGGWHANSAGFRTPESRWLLRSYAPTTLWDECGIRIPVWRAVLEAERLGVRAEWETWVPRWRRDAPWERSEFRRGPVPNLRSHYRGSYWRRMRTAQERRIADGLASDEEALEVGVRTRGRRNATNLIDDREDVHRSNERNWKRHRRTQYRERNQT